VESTVQSRSPTLSDWTGSFAECTPAPHLRDWTGPFTECTLGVCSACIYAYACMRNQLVILSPAQLRAFSPAQLHVFSPAQLRVFSSAQLCTFSSVQVPILCIAKYIHDDAHDLNTLCVCIYVANSAFRALYIYFLY
jgi:hypothetical protein